LAATEKNGKNDYAEKKPAYINPVRLHVSPRFLGIVVTAAENADAKILEITPNKA
jgi:hypothetical protein